MRHFLYYVTCVGLLSSLYGCGTQIGNGVHGRTIAGSTETPGDPAEAAFKEGGTTDIGTTEEGGKKFGLSQAARAQEHIFNTFVSPLSEASSGTFASGAGGAAFKVGAKNSKGEFTVNFSGSNVAVTAMRDQNSGDYALSVDLEQQTVTAGKVTTKLTSSLITKSVLFSDGYAMSWDIDTKNQVQEIRVTNPSADYTLRFRYISSETSETESPTVTPTPVQSVPAQTSVRTKPVEKAQDGGITVTGDANGKDANGKDGANASSSDSGNANGADVVNKG